MKQDKIYLYFYKTEDIIQDTYIKVKLTRPDNVPEHKAKKGEIIHALNIKRLDTQFNFPIALEVLNTHKNDIYDVKISDTYNLYNFEEYEDKYIHDKLKLELNKEINQFTILTDHGLSSETRKLSAYLDISEEIVENINEEYISLIVKHIKEAFYNKIYKDEHIYNYVDDSITIKLYKGSITKEKYNGKEVIEITDIIYRIVVEIILEKKGEKVWVGEMNFEE